MIKGVDGAPRLSLRQPRDVRTHQLQPEGDAREEAHPAQSHQLKAAVDHLLTSAPEGSHTPLIVNVKDIYIINKANEFTSL